MPGPIDLATFRAQKAAKLAEHAQLGAAAASAAAQATVLETQAQVMANTGQTAMAMQFRAQAAAVRGSRDQLLQKQSDLAALLGELIGANLGDPCDLSSDTPLLLLPVRLETRFGTQAVATGGTEQTLKVRIFPDQIHLDTLRRALTADEAKAGSLYWASAKSDDDWRALIAAAGERRVAWVAERTRPGVPPVTDDKAGPVARLLPDCFVVEVLIGGNATTPIRKTGNAIPVAPSLGLFADNSAPADYKVVNSVPLTDPNAAWIADFGKAEEIGLAVTVSLGKWSTKTIQRVMVYGVCSRSATDTAADLDRLLESHRYADGLGFVRQGTPTNNVAEQRAGWTPAAPKKPPATPAAAIGNRARLATALGITGSAFAGIDGADNDDDADARATNAALWSPTWGSFLDRLDLDTPNGPFKLSDAQREAIRVFHRDAVRGRGPLPAIRVGTQPYGILPIGATQNKDWTASDADQVVLKGVRGARKYWAGSTSDLPHLAAGMTPEATFNAIMALNPVSFGVRARQAGADDLFDLDGSGNVDTTAELEAFLDALILEDIYGQLQGGDVTHSVPVVGGGGGFSGKWTSKSGLSLSKDDKPIGLPYAHQSDPQVLQQIAAGSTPQQLQSVLQALAALALADNRKLQVLHPVNGFDQLNAKLDATTRKIGAADVASAGQRGSAGLYQLAAVAETPATGTAIFSYYQPDPSNMAGYASLATGSTNATAAKELAGLGIHAGILAQAISAEFVESLTRLASPALSVKDRAILVAEAIDTASHRYDAWVTGLAQRRAIAMRAKAPAGLHVGAFGYVENIISGNAGNFGFIHTPGMAHAATAGILRSAFLSHQQEGSKNAFAIDLTSARVRTAMDLIDARRSGQGLGEALGYRIERSLQTGGLGRFVRNLRAFAPLKGAAPATPQPDGVASETLGAGNVVDGVKLIETFRTQGIAPITTAASKPPADNPYLKGAWSPVQSGPETTALTAAVSDASDAMDAVSDLLMAESVYQLVQGNTARAAAAMDAASSGNSPVREPAVIATPVTSRSIAHRTLLIAAPGMAGWPGGAANPRAVVSPELEGWAAGRIGMPERIVLGVGANGVPVTLAGARMCALDFVYSAGDRAALENRLRTELTLAPGFAFAEERASAWGAGMVAFGEVIAAADALRGVLAGARPAEGRDFGTPHDDTKRSYLTGIVSSRLAPARNTFQSRIATLKGAGQPGTTIPGTLASLTDFGIVPPAGLPDADTLARFVIELEARAMAYDTALGANPDQNAIAAAGRALFGEGFWICTPMTALDAASPWNAPSPAKPSRLRRWLADIGSVRAALTRYADGLLLCEALGKSPALSAVQLAEPGAETVTQTFAGDTSPDGIAVIALVERSGDPAGLGTSVALVLDDYNEPLPDPAPRSSAIAFNAPAPGARPPQSCLLAVSPDAKRWTTDKVAEVIQEAFALAQMRGVTLASANIVPRLLPATYVQSWSLRGESVIDFKTVGTDLPRQMNYVKDA